MSVVGSEVGGQNVRLHPVCNNIHIACFIKHEMVLRKLSCLRQQCLDHDYKL